MVNVNMPEKHTVRIDADKVGVRTITCMDHHYLYELTIVGASRNLALMITIDAKKCSWVVTAWTTSHQSISDYVEQADTRPINMVTCRIEKRESPPPGLRVTTPKIPFGSEFLTVIKPIIYIEEGDGEEVTLDFKCLGDDSSTGPDRDTFG